MNNNPKTRDVKFRPYVRRYRSFFQGVRDKRMDRWSEFPQYSDQVAYEYGRVFATVSPYVTTKMLERYVYERPQKSSEREHVRNHVGVFLRAIL